MAIWVAQDRLSTQSSWAPAGKRSISSLQTDVFLTDLFWLAWHAEKRTGSSTLDFDAWVNMLETVEAVGGDELAPLESNQPIG